MLTSSMSRIPPEHRRPASPALWLCLLLPLMGCAAAPKPQLAVAPPPPQAAPLYSATIAAIRPESSSQDPTGSLQQIMSILGEPAPQAANASEIVMHMPDNSIKTSVQSTQPALAPGARVVVTAGPAASSQPN